MLGAFELVAAVEGAGAGRTRPRRLVALGALDGCFGLRCFVGGWEAVHEASFSSSSAETGGSDTV